MTSLLFVGRIVTMAEGGHDPAAGAPAEAVLVVDDRIRAVGSEAELRGLADGDTEVVELGQSCLMPGLIEPHGHPSSAAVLLSDYVLDIRPVTLATADEVTAALTAALAERPVGVFANGWDPLLQKGLVNPTIQSLDALAGAIPLVILHNSGHSVFFNSAAARAAGLDDSTPDPAGSSFGRDAQGHLTGVGYEAGAVFQVCSPVLLQARGDFVRVFRDEVARTNAAGVTTIADLSWEASTQAGLEAVRAEHPLTVRLRLYEMSAPGARASVALENGDDVVRQIGVKTWADGSPWIGNIATSYPYLDTAATRAMGLEPGHHGALNFDSAQILAISRQYAAAGWQLACHAHGDLAIDATLDAWQQVIEENSLTDHRFRLEHVGAMTASQFARAAALGVVVSIFSDHLYYWGDVLVDDLFGPEHGGRWADSAAAIAAGLAPTFHNDGTVTPLEPFRNMATAMTRRTRSGRLLTSAGGFGGAASAAAGAGDAEGAGATGNRVGGSVAGAGAGAGAAGVGGLAAGGAGATNDGALVGIGIDDALRAHTTAAAKQLFAEEIVGSIEPGKYADLIVIDRDPYAVTPEELAATRVLATYFAGSLVPRASFGRPR
ncbi:amidohydrolase [Subtercola endophyticus]|uniref:amidohydrolase n=1 Tax=Subtercola endophyticus TaxID=2895559 RepID=UPI001E2D1742|nr:amidohydrolase family protein [Subtercola endophyticus]UFS60799.1 amidohydrolase [Subtercola endophyticus]